MSKTRKLQFFLSGERLANKFLKDSRDAYTGILEIDESLILVNGHDAKCNGIEILKGVMKTRRQKIVGTEKLPKLCEEMQRIIKPWRDDGVHVISWQDYHERVKKKYQGMDEDTLQSATKYLHLMGEVYWAEFVENEDQVILDTHWFTTNVIGAAFAGQEFETQFPVLPNKTQYSLEELSAYFTDEIDTLQLLGLLGHMDLVHKTKDNMYLWPGKLPKDTPEIVWEAENTYVRGKSIECVADIDIFNPNVYPSVQKKLLDENKYPRVSRSAVIYEDGAVKVLVQMTKTKRAINIAAMCSDKDDIEACSTSLEKAVDRIQSEITEKSPGTSFRVNFISQDSLKTSRNLDDVLTYTRDNLVQAERENSLLKQYGKQEEVTKILFPGYDEMFLQEFGAECGYEWLPMDVVTRCFRRLDRINEEWEEDYRAVGKALKIEPDEVDLKEQPTNKIIKIWCKKNKRKMTIVMLHKLLSRLSLVTNVDALIAVEELIDKCQTKHSNGGSGNETFEPGVSEAIVRWRVVLKRQWEALKAYMDPRMLALHLQCLEPAMCTAIEESSDQRTQKVKRLLQLLLHCEKETWPSIFIDALRDETKQLHLAKALKEDFEKVASENKTEADSPSDGTSDHTEGKQDDVHDVAESKDGDKMDDSEKPDVEHNRPTADSKEEDNEGIPGKHGRHVMISYQWDAQERMKTLKDKLENEGFQVWLDIEKIASLVSFYNMKGDKKDTGTGKRLFESPKRDSTAKQRKKEDGEVMDIGKLTDMESTTHVQESQNGGAHGSDAAPTWFTQFEERFNRVMTTTRHEIGHEIQDLKQALDFHTSQCDDRFQEMEKKLESAYDKIDDLENRSRRNNLVFSTFQRVVSRTSLIVQIL
ncbi:uncharacterized protein [Amphiura filiformis]|uniref:uncharacterized protein n=1 Tax=Amphiura filiformis TaxID=82378 RepID=UPI003B227725